VAHVLIMPRQGNTVESCLLVRWKVAEGAKVAPEDVLCEVETDKATFEVNAGAGGVLLKALHTEGDDVPVLEPIAVIGEPGEDWHSAVEAARTGPAVGGAADSTPRGGSPPPQAPAEAQPAAEATGGPAHPASPRARRLAAEGGVDLTTLSGTGPGERIIERDVKAALSARPRLTAAARAAVSSGARLPSGAGSALGGRAGLADLVAPVAGPVTSAAGEGYSETPVRGIRKIIAERMRSSLATTAQLTFHGSAPAERLAALRARFKSSDPALGLSGITIGDLVLYVVSRVVPRFPVVNSHLVGATIRTFERVHLGLAVDTPRGLLVPVIRNADQLGLGALSAEAKRLAKACLAGNVSPDDLAGATFTVSNLGAFGVESFTPVLNAPEVGILGVSAITPRVAAGPDGTPLLESRMGLSLTVDHQVIDGAPAARILKAFSDAIADIDLLWAR
jgi:pyruvate dehydrogenase E2 component (dihydrolipoamide acetyltransferase)